MLRCFVRQTWEEELVSTTISLDGSHFPFRLVPSRSISLDAPRDSRWCWVGFTFTTTACGGIGCDFYCCWANAKKSWKEFCLLLGTAGLENGFLNINRNGIGPLPLRSFPALNQWRSFYRKRTEANRIVSEVTDKAIAVDYWASQIDSKWWFVLFFRGTTVNKWTHMIDQNDE